MATFRMEAWLAGKAKMIADTRTLNMSEPWRSFEGVKKGDIILRQEGGVGCVISEVREVAAGKGEMKLSDIAMLGESGEFRAGEGEGYYQAELKDSIVYHLLTRTSTLEFTPPPAGEREEVNDAAYLVEIDAKLASEDPIVHAEGLYALRFFDKPTAANKLKKWLGSSATDYLVAAGVMYDLNIQARWQDELKKWLKDFSINDLVK